MVGRTTLRRNSVPPPAALVTPDIRQKIMVGQFVDPSLYYVYAHYGKCDNAVQPFVLIHQPSSGNIHLRPKSSGQQGSI